MLQLVARVLLNFVRQPTRESGFPIVFVVFEGLRHGLFAIVGGCWTPRQGEGVLQACNLRYGRAMAQLWPNYGPTMAQLWPNPWPNSPLISFYKNSCAHEHL